MAYSRDGDAMRYDPNGNGVLKSAAVVVAASPMDAFVVTPSDVTVFSPAASALYVGGTGNVNVVTELGTTVLFSAVPVGTFIPLRVTKVMSTSTTATLIVALV